MPTLEEAMAALAQIKAEEQAEAATGLAQLAADDASRLSKAIRDLKKVDEEIAKEDAMQRADLFAPPTPRPTPPTRGIPEVVAEAGRTIDRTVDYRINQATQPLEDPSDFYALQGMAETDRDLKRIMQNEGTVRDALTEAQEIWNMRGPDAPYHSRPQVKGLDTPVEESEARPGLLQMAGDYMTRPISMLAGVERVLLSGGSLEEAYAEGAKGLKGGQKTNSAQALEAAGMPNPPLLDTKVDYSLLRNLLPGASAGGARAVAARMSSPDELKIKVGPRDILGLIGDVVQDPLTYLSFGTNRAVPILRGAYRLNRNGLRALRVEVEANMARGMGRAAARNAAERKLGTMIEGGATKLIDRGGIKLAGRTLPGTGAVQAQVRNIIRGAADYSRSTAAGKRLADEMTEWLGYFDRDARIRMYPDFRYDRQKYLDMIAYDKNNAMDMAHAIFHGTTRKERVQITHAIDSANIGALPDELQDVAQKVVDHQTMLRKLDKLRGMGSEVVEDYMMRRYTNHPRAVKTQGGLPGGVTPHMSPNLKRQYGDRTLEKVMEEEKLIPVTEDAMELFLMRFAASSRAHRANELIEQTMQKYGRVAQMGPGGPGLRNRELIQEGLETSPHFHKAGFDIAIPKAIKDEIADMGVYAESVTPQLTKLLDGYQNLWKSSVTGMFPAFHIRNAVSNVALSFLDMGISAANPARHMQAIDVLNGLNGKLLAKTGEQYSYKEIRNLFEQNGLKGAFGGKLGIVTPELFDFPPQGTFATLQKAREATGKIGAKVGLKTSKTGNKLADLPLDAGPGINLLRAGREKIGEPIEQEARMMHFISALRRGFSPEEAAARTKQFLFDYDNLSKAERSILRRAIPFYTFYRKNVPLQLKALLQEPGRQSVFAKLMMNVGDSEEIKEVKARLPEFIKKGSVKIVGTSDNGSPILLYGTGLPFEDLAKAFPSARRGESHVGEASREFLSMLGPVAKVAAERWFNKDVFLDRPIEDVNQIYSAYGEALAKSPKAIQDFVGLRSEPDRKTGKIRYEVDPFKFHLLRSFVTSRLYSTTGKIVDERIDPTTRFLNALTGMRYGVVDFEKQVLGGLTSRSAERKDQALSELKRQKRWQLKELMEQPPPASR